MENRRRYGPAVPPVNAESRPQTGARSRQASRFWLRLGNPAGNLGGTVPETVSLPTLVIDASSPEVVVGLRTTDSGSGDLWRRAKSEAGVGIFTAMDALLRQAQVGVDDLRSITFCDGPGSLLGIRIAAMAIRTWSAIRANTALEVFSWRSLELAAIELLAEGNKPPFVVIADARRASWHVLVVDTDGEIGEITRVSSESPRPPHERVFAPRAFPHRQPLPLQAQLVDYEPEKLWRAVLRRPRLLRRCASPEAFMTQMPEYRKWVVPGGSRQ